ncbi:sulfotransferase 1E1-like [Crassostrea angulata]|uniref:sulfotransferase 1E1-like n=1 Tax=Magallana angulata TaxID=2784310 RepID=UPI0022B19E7C|nr:sulfotransferase 1E1-like [Crassostrea angulata]
MDINMDESNFRQTQPIMFDGMALPPFPPLLQDAKKRFEELRNMEYRMDDIILAIYPKSGTHWVWEIVCMLLKQKAEYSKEPKELFFLEAMADLSMVESMESPRALNTHLPHRLLPKQHIENGGKIVHVVRNPKDVCVSMYHHMKSSEEIGKIKDFETFYHTVFMNPNAKLMDGWFKYEKDFEQAEKNNTGGTIFSVHYESLKKNPITEISRLAEFLNINLKDQDIAEIADKCSFKKLKLANDTMKDHSILDIGEKYPGEKIKEFMFRKGEIGDWKNHFTVSMNEHFDAVFKEEMKDSNIRIQFE